MNETNQNGKEQKRKDGRKATGVKTRIKCDKECKCKFRLNLRVIRVNHNLVEYAPQPIAVGNSGKLQATVVNFLGQCVCVCVWQPFTPI